MIDADAATPGSQVAAALSLAAQRRKVDIEGFDDPTGHHVLPDGQRDMHELLGSEMLCRRGEGRFRSADVEHDLAYLSDVELRRDHVVDRCCLSERRGSRSIKQRGNSNRRLEHLRIAAAHPERVTAIVSQNARGGDAAYLAR
jgi:hypothetical protein